MHRRRQYKAAPRQNFRDNRASRSAVAKHEEHEIVETARKYLWRTLPLVEGSLHAPMMCIASHAEDIIKKPTWRQYHLAQLSDHNGRYSAYLTPTMAYMVLRDGLSHTVVQRV